MKPILKLPGRFKSQEAFFSQVGELLAARNFFNFDGRHMTSENFVGLSIRQPLTSRVGVGGNF